jgi:hypothetical protein
MSDLSMSRARNPDLPTSQLRVDEVPKWVLDMLDAVSMAEGEKYRGPLVIAILEKWAKQEARKHTLIARIVGGNQSIAEFAEMGAE